MPYILKGNTVYKKKGKKLVKVGTSKKPKKYLRLLKAIEHGFRPKRKLKVKS